MCTALSQEIAEGHLDIWCSCLEFSARPNVYHSWSSRGSSKAKQLKYLIWPLLWEPPEVQPIMAHVFPTDTSQEHLWPAHMEESALTTADQALSLCRFYSHQLAWPPQTRENPGHTAHQNHEQVHMISPAPVHNMRLFSSENMGKTDHTLCKCMVCPSSTCSSKCITVFNIYI